MIALKSDSTVIQDDVTRATGELVNRLEVLEAIGFDDAALQHQIEAAREMLERALEPLLESRRRSGDLPADGSVERPHLEALVLRTKAAFSADSQAHTVAENLLEDLTSLRQHLTTAQLAAGQDSSHEKLLAELERTARELSQRFAAFC